MLKEQITGMKRTSLINGDAGSLGEFNSDFPGMLIVEFGFFGSFTFSPCHKFGIVTVKLFQQ